jgi:7-cyano-7-deazaguanine reductase
MDLNAPAPIEARRRAIAPQPNPERALDYLIILRGKLALPDGAAAVRLRYVPDRLILPPPALDAYITTLAGQQPAGLEAAGAAMLRDIGNEVVPRWLQVRLTRRIPAHGRHVVVLEESQPGWENPGLLARLGL